MRLGFPVLTARRPARDPGVLVEGREGTEESTLQGRGRLAAHSSGPAASKGYRQRPPAPAPRKHSPCRALSRDPRLLRASESLPPLLPQPPRGRALMGAGGGPGARGAGRAGGSLGPGKAAGCAQRRDWPRGSSLGPRPEPARWAEHGAWTPPLTPVQT